MSTACKCDRCAGLFEHAPRTVTAEYHVTTKVDTDGSPTQVGYEADLCQQCSAEFLTFIKHKDESQS